MPMENNIEEKLKKYARFETEDDVARFDQLISQISEKRDPKYVPVLMEAFDDNTEFEEVMYSLVHAVESYPRQIYVPLLIKEIPYGLKSHPYWLERLVNRIFNDESYLRDFRKNMHLIHKGEMIKLLDLVAQESEHHRKLCVELKEELLRSSKDA